MFWLAKLKISLRTCFEFFYETSNFIFQVKASLHLIDHNLELMHTNTQEAEGDEKAEVQVSFSNIWHWNQSVFIHLTLGPISIHKCNGYKLGELPRQADGEQDQEACLLCLGGFPFHRCHYINILRARRHKIVKLFIYITGGPEHWGLQHGEQPGLHERGLWQVLCLEGGAQRLVNTREISSITCDCPTSNPELGA